METIKSYGLYDGDRLVEYGSLASMAYCLYARKFNGDYEDLWIGEIEIKCNCQISQSVYDTELERVYGGKDDN